MTTPPPTSRVVRAFISSTFRDFGEERDLLMKRVFPELRRRARARFVEVIGVDLRWGITEEESQKGETLPICLREIERSRPYFIGLLGERYGWTPAAGQYPAELLERQPWLMEHAGGRSVTELEILHGVLNSPEMAGRAYFYFREPAWSEGKGEGFRSEGEDERARLARLKERIRASPFPVAEYATPEALADRITEDLWRLIDAEYPESEVPDELERERRSHEAYAHERRRLYVGQEATVAALLARLEGASDEKGDEAAARTRTTLVTGESGTGKSALIANTLEKYREAHTDHVVIEHYIGSTSDAADPAKLMQRIAGEIRKLTGSTREIESDPEKLVEQFAEWLAEASWWAGRRGVKVVIALDALDKLSGEEWLRWLPRKTAPHLRLVLSSLACEAREALEKRGVETVEAKPFTNEVARAYLVETLARRGRRLPPREVERIVAHPRARLPIYLRTLVEELSVFGTHEGLPQRITECLAAQEPDDLFEMILARVEGDLGEEKVRRPLEAIWASADGMSEDELVAFTGLSRLDLARLRLSLDDALYESGGLVRLAHAYMSKAVEDRYLPTEELKRALHKALGLWWETQEPSARMGYSVDLHLYRAEAWDDLERCLTAPRTASAVLRAMSAYSLHCSWRRIAAARGGDDVASYIGQAIETVWPQWRVAWEESDWKSPYTASGDLVSLLYTAGAIGTAELVARTRLSFVKELHKAPDVLETSMELRDSLQILGRVLRERGATSAALECFEQALGIARRRLARGETLENLRALCGSLDSIGKIREEKLERSSALECYVESLDISQRVLQMAFGIDHLRMVTVSLANVGRILLAVEAFEEALSFTRQSIDVAKNLLTITETDEDLRGLCVVTLQLGRVHERMSSQEDAVSCFGESLGIALRRVDEEETADRLEDLNTCLGDFGGALEVKGCMRDALEIHEERLKTARRLLGYGETPARLRSVASSLTSIANTRISLGDREGALCLYKEGVDLAEHLLKQRSTWVELNEVVWSTHLLASCMFQLHRFDEASDRLRRHMQTAEVLEQTSRADSNLLDTCAAYWETSARVEEARGLAADSKHASERAAALRDRIKGF